MKYKICVSGAAKTDCCSDSALELSREIGKEIVKLSIDTLITVGEGGKIIAQSSEDEGMAKEQIFSFQKNEKRCLVKKLSSLIKPKDYILLKGSREMQMEEILQFWQEEYKRNSQA